MTKLGLGELIPSRKRRDDNGKDDETDIPNHDGLSFQYKQYHEGNPR